MKNCILTAVLIGVITAASVMTLASCGDKNDKSSGKISTTTKPGAITGSTAAAVTKASDNTVASGNTATTAAIQDENGNILTTLAPNEEAQQSAGNTITDTALVFFGVSAANGYYASVYTSYTTASGVTYYYVNVMDANNIVKGMVWVGEDGTTVDSDTFYNTYIKPELGTNANGGDNQQATYWITPKGPDHADAGEGNNVDNNANYDNNNNYNYDNNGNYEAYGDNTVAPYYGE